MRQLVNLFAPAIVFEFAFILAISLSTGIKPPVAGVLSLITWAGTIFLFRRYIYNVMLQKDKDNGERFKVFLSIIVYSMIGNIWSVLWYIYVVLFIVRIPQVASYKGDYYEPVVIVLILLLPLVAKFILFWIGAIGERLAIIMS